MAGGETLIPCPRIEPWVVWMKARNLPPDQQGMEILEAICPWIFAPLKNAFLMEAETVKAGTEFIRDIGEQVMEQ